MAFELATAYVSIEANATQFGTQLAKIKQDFLGTVTSMGKMAGLIGIPTTTMAVMYKFVEQLKYSINLAKESAKAFKELSMWVEATGKAGLMSANYLGKYAQFLEQLTGTPATDITKAMSNLLRFENVSSEVFKNVTEKAVALSKRGFGSVEEAAQNLGMILNDPERGMMRLRQYGVTLTEYEKALVKSRMEMGNIIGAQELILGKINVPTTRASGKDYRDIRIRQTYEDLGNQWRQATQGQTGPNWKQNTAEIVHDAGVVAALAVKGINDQYTWWKAMGRRDAEYSMNFLRNSTIFGLLPSGGGNAAARRGRGVSQAEIDAAAILGPTLAKTTRLQQEQMARDALAAQRFNKQYAMKGLDQFAWLYGKGMNLLGAAGPKNVVQPFGDMFQRIEAQQNIDAQKRAFARWTAWGFMKQMEFGAQSLFMNAFGRVDPRKWWVNKEKKELGPGGVTTLEGFNLAFQEALNDQKNPVHKSNEYLRGIELAMGLVKQSTATTAAALEGMAKKALAALPSEIVIKVAQD